jgi:uncharacterized protein GlcG (DUF336 family)
MSHIAKLSLIGIAALGIASAQLTERNLSVTLAEEAALAAMQKCQADGFRVSVVVLDRGGSFKAAVRNDGAGLHTFDTAWKKAFTSASIRIPTTTFVQRVQTNPGLGNIVGVIALGGGLPISIGNEVIGAIGVGGAPSGEADEVCAKAGIDKIADRLR